MITAIVLIDAAPESIPETAQSIAELPGISEVYSVTGEHDLIAIVRVRRYEDFAEVISGRLNKVPGVLDTTTHLAFKTFSRHDLDAAFDLGIE
ncbi:Lrp/AsnC ligand binding domain-containing protein [Sediminivirga luteola]|uniref:AsnC family transcriptional regulator n=1 Tax=Sediminivirga luteola TaxID=1774748 RepID=A0A8J2TZZ3_9MICO|nr:Lrp/AsnC ligand binding domain-containing protein [Sediminivirga luteola]MCI2264034.1 Lrp/AsnC ligand binding domain-containing protein [Sediminivirga luteola]GGA22888.1 AsnC family transcriptional regulator [Sediminivirga luteola]